MTDTDNILEYINDFKKYNFEIQLIKNPEEGCSAIKEVLKGKSECVIVYPADDFINYKILDAMYYEFKKEIRLYQLADL